MKERPVIHVVLNDDGDVEAAFYQKSDAETYCFNALELQEEGLGNDWDCYYQIQEVQCE